MIQLSCLNYETKTNDIKKFYSKGNGYITTAVLKEILRELDDTLNNDDLDAMIEGNIISFA